MSVPDIRTSRPGPKARAITARDARVVSPSYTRGYPLVIEKGEGAVVEDVDGNVFRDCTAGIAVNATGHAHPEVVAAVTEPAGRFLHMSGTDFYYDVQVRLAEEVAALDADRRRGQVGGTPSSKLESPHLAWPLLFARAWQTPGSDWENQEKISPAANCSAAGT